MRRARWLLAAGLAVAVPIALPAPLAVAQADEGEAPIDPFPVEVRQAMKRQDKQLDDGELETLVREADERARDGTPDSLYLLGRAHGMAAMVARAGGKATTYKKHLDLARDSFSRSQEAGGLLYAPALVGLARCGWIDRDLEIAAKYLKEALQVDRHFRMAVLEFAQVQWNRNLRAEAETVLSNFLREHPKDIETRMLLGELNRRRKQWDEAEREFRVVVGLQPKDARARKLLSLCLAAQQKWDQTVEHLEYLVAAEPADADSWKLLYQVHKQLGRKDEAVAALESIVENCADTEEATAAQTTLDAIREDPTYFTRAGRPTAERLMQDLDSSDPMVLRHALGRMRQMDWRQLPPNVYRLLDPATSGTEVRLASLWTIRSVGNVLVLPVLEELLFHPKFRDPALVVRRAVAESIAQLDTEASILVLHRMLDSDDVTIREAGVRGIAERTGKSFRADLDVVTPAKDWPAERAKYAEWWKRGSGTIAKRASLRAWDTFLTGSGPSKSRIGGYFLDAMDDPMPITWREAYARFRKVTGQSFGAEGSPPDRETRDRVLAEARQWFEANVTPGKAKSDGSETDR